MDFEIIDFHMHPFLSPENNMCHYKESVDLDAHTTAEDMQNAGIRLFCGSVIQRGPMQGFDTLRSCNREALRLREIYNNTYIPGFHVHPHYIAESLEEISLAKKENVKLIGELVPYIHGWSDYSCKEFSVILEEIERNNMIVNLHPMGMMQMAQTASEHKRIPFIFAHPGERTRVLENIDIMKKHDNVYLDISGTGILRYGVLRHLVNEVGAERILFGTDYPIGNPSAYVHGVLGEKLSDREKELILSGNAKRLLFNVHS